MSEPLAIAALVEEMTTRAKRNLERAPDSFLATGFIVEPGGIVTIVGMVFRTTLEKRLMHAALRLEAEARHAVATFVITDAWISRWGPNDPPLLPRRDPDRREALVVTLHQDGRTTGCTYPYHREGERVIWDAPLPMSPAVHDFNWDQDAAVPQPEAL